MKPIKWGGTWYGFVERKKGTLSKYLLHSSPTRKVSGEKPKDKWKIHVESTF
jgi:hypothetical protein